MLDSKNLMKLIAMIVLILVLPSLFFAYIGQDPTKQQERATGQIAIVNEDLGAEFHGEHVSFGQAVTSSLGENSEYDYVVVGRNTAENGLKRNEYDGILYLSSDFSRSILTFKDQEPQRASLRYQIQPNLEARNIERVQRSIQNARNRINRQVTSIYWDVISQEVDDVRKKFDTIVEREMAFQEAMYSFYSPNSQNIANEVETQKELLEQLVGMTNDAIDQSSVAIDGMDSYEEQLSEFLDKVQTFKEYQKNQNELLLTTNLQNKKLVEMSVQDYEVTVNGSIDTVLRLNQRSWPEFDQGEVDVTTGITDIKESLNDSHARLSEVQDSTGVSAVSKLSDSILSKQQKMIKDYRETRHERVLGQLESTLLPLREQLVAETPRQDLTEPENGEVAFDRPSGEVETGDALSGVKSQLEDLEVLINQIPIEETELESGNEQIQAIQGAVALLHSEIQEVESRLDAQTDIINGWETTLNEVIDQLNQSPSPTANGNDEILREKIKGLESRVLDGDSLSTARKEVIKPYFQKALGSWDVDQLLTYYSYLAVYHHHATSPKEADNQLMDDILAEDPSGEMIEGAFQVINSQYEEFGSEFQTTVSSVEELDRDIHRFVYSLNDFMGEYEVRISEEQEKMLSELEQLEESTSLMAQNLRVEFETIDEPEAPVTDLNGDLVLSTQLGTLSNIEQVANLVDSLSERSIIVTEYTGELYNQVDSVQARADELNQNWGRNVETSQLVQEDMSNILRNAIVDGQPNPFVYDHLSNPVKLSGEAPEERTNQTPPVVLLIIILVSGLLIGMFVFYFNYVPMKLNIAMFLLLNLAVGLIISIYGLTIYPLHDTAAFMWTVVTVLFLLATSGLVHVGLTIGLIAGGLTMTGLVFFYVIPFIDLVMPNFSMNHPISNVYMSIQFGNQSLFGSAVIALCIIGLIVSVSPYIIRHLQTKEREEVEYDESYDA